VRLALLAVHLQLHSGLAHAQPVTTAPAGAAANVYLHTVVRGDTLIGLGRALLEDRRKWPAIQALNRVRNPRRLRPGTRLRFPLELLRSLPGSAEVLWVRGQPQVRQPDGITVVALLGSTIAPGSTLVTATAQSVRIRLSTGGTLTVGERTQLTFTELRSIPAAGATRTRLQIDRGRIESAVEPSPSPARRYEIHTPVVTTAVRGTEFRVAVDDAGESAATEVTDGRVEVARAAETMGIAAGFGTMARRDQPLAAPRALLPAVATQPIEAALTRLPIRMRWSPVPGAAAYRVQLTPDGGGAIVDDRQVTGSDAVWPDLADGRYVVTLRAIDEVGLEGMDARRPFTVDARPVPPIVEHPQDGASLVGDAVGLRWTRPEGVTAFDVEVSREGEAAPAAGRTASPEAAWPLPLPPGAYVWRVASRDASGRGPWGDPLRFTLRARPPAGPAATHAVDRARLALRWPAGLAGDRYHVQVSGDRAFASTLVDDVVADPAASMPRPPAGTYFVRVSFVDADGVEGPFGPVQSLVVPKLPPSRWQWLLISLPTIGALIALL
jgi:hypothetical protein